MNRKTAYALSITCLFLGLILADSLTNWDTWVKVAAAVVLALVPLGFIRTPQPTPTATAATTTTTATPAKPKPDQKLDRTWTWILTLMFAALVVYGAVFWVGKPIYDLGEKAIHNSEATTVIQNGFPRHDAPLPEQRIIAPFNKVLTAGQTYNVFSLKAGDIYKVVSMRGPIDLRIDHSSITGFDHVVAPRRFRARVDGTLQVSSSTSRNEVFITRE